MKRTALVVLATAALLCATTVHAQVATIAPTQLNFGQVLVGQTSAPQMVILKNTGVAELTVSSIAISGNFALPTNTCGSVVKPGLRCRVDVTFTPHALETETGSLTFTDNASNSPQVVSLTGTGSSMASTQTTVTASTTKILAGTPVTFTVTVVSLGGGTIPDGDQVVLSSTQGVIGSGTLKSGMAIITTSELKDTNPPEKRPGGAVEPVTAVYAGDASFSSSSSRAIGITVDRWPTSGSVAITPNPSMYCQPIMFTPYIISSGPNAPTGDVFFLEFTPNIGPVAIGQTETFSGCSFQGGVIRYEGDAYNDWTTLVTSQTINPSTTTTAITSSKNPSALGKEATFKVHVSAPWAKTVNGSVTFTAGTTSGTTTIGTVQLLGNAAVIHTSSLPAGQNTITATYNPGSIYSGKFLSSSASLVQTVQ